VRDRHHLAPPGDPLRRPARGLDAVIPRIGATHTFYGTAVVRQFEMMGVYPTNESQAISRSRDKLRSLQLLAAEGSGCRSPRSRTPPRTSTG
jgi:glutathione synthase/RimK-type ligase-like ATP-grasp enzyme